MTAYPGIAAECASEQSELLARTASENSAPRMSCAYSAGSPAIFRRLLARRALGSETGAVTTSVNLSNSGDDSAWRVAMNNSEGNLEMVLTLLAQRFRRCCRDSTRDPFRNTDR